MADRITERICFILGDAYDAKATYKVVRPAMVGLPKYAGFEKVGEFAEDSRESGMLVILRAKPVAAPKAPAPVPTAAASAAERVRSMLGRKKP